MPCGSNQSDDRFPEVEYELPGPYARLTTEVTVQGTADPETPVGVEIFIRERIDRSDRLRKVVTVVAHPGQIKPLSADVTSATALVIRLSCGSSALRVTYADPVVQG